MRTLAYAAFAIVMLAAAAPASATTIGLLLPDTPSEAATRAARAAQSSAADKGWTVEVRNEGTGAGDDLAELVRRKVDGLVLVMVRPEAYATELAAAQKAGIPVVTVLAGASPLASFDMTVNQYAIGADSGAYLLGLMNYRGSVLQLRADGDPNGRARGRVLDLMLQDAPGVHAVASVERAAGADWQQAFRRDLQQALQQVGDGPLAVWSASDDMALLAESLLKAKGLGHERVSLTSIGGSEAAFDRIRDPDGLLVATAAIPYELLGEAALDVIDDLAAGTPKGQIAVGPYIYIDPVMVDRGNVPAQDELPW